MKLKAYDKKRMAGGKLMDESTEFRGFFGEKLTLVKQDGGWGHDHLKIYRDGKELCFLHISGKDIDIYTLGGKYICFEFDNS